MSDFYLSNPNKIIKGLERNSKFSNKKGILYNFINWDQERDRIAHLQSTGLSRKMNRLQFDFYLKSSLIRCFEAENNYMSTAK